MDCGCSNDELKEQKRTSELITRQLKQEWNKRKREKILLLLGNTSSGKTTLINQMRNVFGKGFLGDRKKYIDAVHRNVLVAVKALLISMTSLSVECRNPANEETWKYFANFDPNMKINTSHYSMVSRLWRDDGVHSRRSELQLPESADYFLDGLDRISSDGYIPIVEDVLRAYEPTSGVEEHPLVIGSLTYRIVDVGRKCLDTSKKWIHIFNGCAVSAVLFMVDISEYDKVVFSEKTDNRLVNSLENSRVQFQKLSHYQYENFENSIFILIFNKQDIFDDKIRSSHLADHFPAYTGPKQNPEKAKNFICDMFIDSILDKHNHITIHFITAIESNSAREVCKAVKHGVTNMYEFNSLYID